MFTGLIQQVAGLREARTIPAGKRLTLELDEALSQPELGESIAVNGVCLTATGFDGAGFTVDASFESLERTSLARAQPGARFNIERALRLSDRLGGHLVTGHVDGMGAIVRISDRGQFKEVRVRAPADLMGQIAPKGSITIDGISLTVNEVEGDSFTVAVIPHTIANTTIEDWRPGVQVNLETDVIAKYVERLMDRSRSRASLEDFLAGAGGRSSEGK
jgi:riboflavin synthase